MRPNFTIGLLAPLGCIALLSACGGGGGGGSADVGLNEGAYTVESFGYVDPKPESFQPLGDPTAALVRRDEVAVLLEPPLASFSIEDAITGTATNPPIPANATAGLVPIMATHGDLDGDGRPEVILIGTAGPASQTSLEVRVLGQGAGGWSLLGSFSIGGPGEDYTVGRVDAGDVDGDGRDEIIVAATRAGSVSWVRVYDDPIGGGGYGALLQGFDFPGTTQVRAIAAQLDDDPARELVMTEVFAGGTAKTRAFDDATTGYAFLKQLSTSTHVLSMDLVALNRDGDARDEIAIVRTDDEQNLYVYVFEDAVQGLAYTGKQFGPIDAGQWSSTNPATLRRVAAGDLDGDGLDELVIGLLTLTPGVGYHAQVRVIWGSNTSTTTTITAGEIPLANIFGISLAIVDRDCDGKGEIVFALSYRHSSGDDSVFLCDLSHDQAAASKLKKTTINDVPAASGGHHVVLAGDDFDMDGVHVKYLGHKFLNLPNPIPVVVMAAPPTKKGISQNYDGSEVAYSTATSTGSAYSTAMGSSLSFSVGLDIEDPTGAFGATFKRSWEIAREQTIGTETVIETSKTYTGAHDDDVVIFQGALHMVFEYEFISAADPAAVGTKVTFNQPVAMRTYKWTRTFFEQTFGASSTLPSGIFTHVVGSPSSYRTHAEAQDLLATHEGFEGESTVVGQGKGTTAVGLSMEESLENEIEWSTEVESEGEVKMGGPTVGLTYSTSDKWIWKNTVTNATSYECTVGDIEGDEDYFKWAYDYGLFTYRHEADGKPPVQVLNYWTNAFGHGY